MSWIWAGFMFLSAAERAQQQRAMVAPLQIKERDWLCSGCVTGDTRVLVKDRGAVEIETLVEQGPFEVWSGKAWREARAVFTGIKSVMRLTTSWGAQIRLTGDHRVLTATRGWVEAKDLSRGDRLVFEPPTGEPPTGLSLDWLPQVDTVQALQGEERVYDLQVDVDHAFVANCITVHNCYAIKNSYGNPSQIMFQSMRYMLVLQWLQQGTFVENIVNAIQASRMRSTDRLAKLPPSLRWTVPNPNFFRIHDSGDFFSPEYTRAWFEVCRRIPDVMFWAPTRMWMIKKAASTVFSQGIPPNLALRPSALHFGEHSPRVDNPGTAQASVGAAIRLSVVMPGLSAGSGSGKQVPKGTWRCPAYEHVTEGGGLGAKVTRKGEPKLTKTGKVTEAEGTCARAHGPNSPLRGGNDMLDTPDQGYGCRACWRNRETPIFYQEH